MRGFERSKEVRHRRSNAGKWLMNQLYAANNHALCPALFERFCETLSFSTTPDFNVAALDLYHPTRPCAGRSLDSLKSYVNERKGSAYLCELLNPKDKRTGARLFFWLVKIAKVLHSKGDAENAHWVVDFGRRIIPDMLRRPERYNDFSSGQRKRKDDTRRPEDRTRASLETERMRKLRTAVNDLRKPQS